MTVSLRHEALYTTVALLASAAGVLFVTFGRSRDNAAAAPPLEVAVAPVKQKDVPVLREWIGRLDRLVNENVKAQVTGYLMQQPYTEGAFVKDRLLFHIEPRPFLAAVDQARGQVAQTKGRLRQSYAQWAQAEAQVAAADAGQNNMAAKAHLQAARAQVQTAGAQVTAATAAVETAKAALKTPQIDVGLQKVQEPSE